MCKRGDSEMIRLEYPREDLDSYPEDQKVYALQRELERLTGNLMIVLDSIEDDLRSLIDKKGEQ